MTLYPKSVWVFAAFSAAVLLAVNARAGHLDPSFAVIGIVAIVAVETALFLGLFTGGRRAR